MTGNEMFAKWLARQGYEVQLTESACWYPIGPGIFQSFPYQNLINPSELELRDFFKKTGAIAGRYSCPLACNEGKISYHVIWDQPSFDLSKINKKARYDIRSGLGYADYEKISFERMAEEGWQLRCETLERQGRMGAETKASWGKMCLAAQGLEGFEAWGAVHEGELAASILTYTADDCASILYQQSRTYHMKYGINNALAYVFTREALQRTGIRKVFYGLHSLDAPEGVDRFKFRMGFYPQPVRQRIAINPSLKLLFNPASYRLVRLITKLFPQSPKIAKVEGVMRFYLEGKKPLAEQRWPDCLEENRDQILSEIRNQSSCKP